MGISPLFDDKLRGRISRTANNPRGVQKDVMLGDVKGHGGNTRIDSKGNAKVIDFLPISRKAEREHAERTKRNMGAFLSGPSQRMMRKTTRRGLDEVGLAHVRSDASVKTMQREHNKAHPPKPFTWSMKTDLTPTPPSLSTADVDRAQAHGRVVHALTARMNAAHFNHTIHGARVAPSDYDAMGGLRRADTRRALRGL